jgi:hypothetical protein
MCDTSMCQCSWGFFGLHEAGAFLRGRVPAAVQASRRLEHPVHRRRADRHHVVIQHHERQPAIAFQRMAVVIVQDRLPFPVFQPVIARHRAVVFVGLTVALLPLMELARPQLQPGEELLLRQSGTLGPVADVVHDLVARVVGNPASIQSSPASFFAWTLASISSAMTSFF